LHWLVLSDLPPNIRSMFLVTMAGSAHSGAEVELRKAVARRRLAAGQGELDPGLAAHAPGGPLPITASRMAHL
jgi:hypothetical protein